VLVSYLVVTKLSTARSPAAPPRRRLPRLARRALIEDAATGVFAERGFHGASVDEIARRSGVSVPVLYDHFESKAALHRRLLERHFAELRQLWRDHLTADAPPERRIAVAFDAWFAYVEEHPYAWRILLRDTSGVPEVQAFHREVELESRALLMPLFAGEPGAENIAGSTPELLEMGLEAARSTLQGLAHWWYDHQDIPRKQLVATAMNVLWIGFERVRRGEQWQP
jgi:AcrR family transcriptional regulator